MTHEQAQRMNVILLSRMLCNQYTINRLPTHRPQAAMERDTHMGVIVTSAPC